MLKRLLVGFIILMSALTGVGGAGGGQSVSAIYCTKWTDGLYGYGRCAGASSVVNILCTRAWYYGGGSYERVGNWVPAGVVAYARCDEWPWKATDPRVFTR